MQIKRLIILVLAAFLIVKVLNFRLVDYNTPNFKKQCEPMQTEEFLSAYELDAFLPVWSEYVRSGQKDKVSDKISLLSDNVAESLPLSVRVWFNKQCWEPARFFSVEQRLQSVINTARLNQHTDGVKKVLTDLLQSEKEEVKIQSYKDMLAMQDKIANVEHVTEDEVALVSGREYELDDVLSGKIAYQSKNKYFFKRVTKFWQKRFSL